MSELSTIYAPVRAELDAVEDCLFASTTGRHAKISEAVGTVLRAGGKRLRPALVLLAAKACGYSGERSVQLATALELIHTASLLHDDVIDEAQVRRGVPTANSRWGAKTSILLGDYVYSKVIGLLAEDGNTQIIRCIATAVMSMTDGEVAESLRRDEGEASEKVYLDTIAGKTASLLSCCCRVGGMLAPTPNGEADALGEYGRNLGMAFQITDDLLDIFGDEQCTGKQPGSDIREGILTLPLIHALGQLQDGERTGLLKLFHSVQNGGDGFEQLAATVRDAGGIEYCIARARHYARAGQERVMALPASPSRASLIRFADFVVERVH